MHKCCSTIHQQHCCEKEVREECCVCACVCACMYTASKEQLCQSICLLSFRADYIVVIVCHLSRSFNECIYISLILEGIIEGRKRNQFFLCVHET